ncbi:MAG: GAP family protein [Ilumatobacteraceae bacterium]
MPDLVRTLILCGILSGTQPVTVMGLLLVMAGGENSKRKGLAYLSGAFLVESSILLFSSFVLGDTVSNVSTGGRVLLIIRLLLGFALLVMGVRMRKAPKKPQPEVPKSLERLQGMGPGKAFLAGLALADYQGPVIGSMAISAASVSLSGRLAAFGLYTLLATGIPLTIFIIVLRSQKALNKMNHATGWVMHNRRMLASWFGIVLGTLLIGDAVLGLLKA